MEYDALRIVFNKFHSVVSFPPTVATVLSPEVMGMLHFNKCAFKKKKKSFPYFAFGFKTLCLCGCYAYVDCGERVWIWGKSWWARFLWDWRWGNQGRNTTKPGRVPIFLCKFSFRLKVFLFLNSSCQLGLCLLFSVTIKLSCMN